jgi:hypothetical protein
MRSNMTNKKKQQKPASAGKKKPAAAGKRIYAKPPDLTRATEAELDEFAAWFFRQLCEQFPEIQGDDKKGTPGTGD